MDVYYSLYKDVSTNFILIFCKRRVIDVTEHNPDAEQLEFFDIPSPCIGVCESGPRGFCKGCFRSRDERLYWLKVDGATKRKIISACARRKQAVLSRERKKGMPQHNDSGEQFSLFDEPQ